MNLEPTSDSDLVAIIFDKGVPDIAQVRI